MNGCVVKNDTHYIKITSIVDAMNEYAVNNTLITILNSPKYTNEEKQLIRNHLCIADKIEIVTYQDILDNGIIKMCSEHGSAFTKKFVMEEKEVIENNTYYMFYFPYCGINLVDYIESISIPKTRKSRTRKNIRLSGNINSGISNASNTNSSRNTNSSGNNNKVKPKIILSPLEIFSQCIMCLNVLHSYGYAHTDAHLGNFLITDNGKIMLIDLDSKSNNYYNDFYMFMIEFKKSISKIPKLLLDLINVITNFGNNPDTKLKNKIVDAIHKTTSLSSEDDIFKLLCNLKSTGVLINHSNFNNSKCPKSFLSRLTSTNFWTTLLK
jgi:hypothetical protein